MVSAKYYQELLVWQKSMDLVVMVYETAKLLSKEELYSLSDQIRRAAVSIPSNIAEGQQRKTTKEFINFLSIAKGSLAELETQMLICVRLGYSEKSQIDQILVQTKEIGRMINGLMSSLQKATDN